MAWEGLAVLPGGVVIAGDELRPGSNPPEAAGPDADGGSLFKFVPAAPRTTAGPIARLEDSPLVAGSVHGLQVSCVGNAQQHGQGCEVGIAAWIPVNAATARADADRTGATGYYRPEDLHQDPGYRDPDNPAAVRFCWANTQSEDAGSFGEVLCAIDGAPDRASATERTVLVTRFIQGDADFNSFDNLDFQPRTGNLYVVEDHANGDVFACLPDGADRDLTTDGCVKVMSVRDSSAEPTGLVFTADGSTAYLSIQHSRDDLMPLVDGFRTDDVLKITGFKVRRGRE
jgi:secreted PhoX family phosphatase